jgi:hypothetical protein
LYEYECPLTDTITAMLETTDLDKCISDTLRAAFLYESFHRSFFVLKVHFRLELFWRKCARKMLVKLTTGEMYFRPQVFFVFFAQSTSK